MLAGLVAATLVAGACSSKEIDSTPTTTTLAPGPVVNVRPGGPTAPSATPRVTLGEGSPASGVAAAVQVVSGEPLGPDEVADLIARLPAWEVPDDDADDFVRPPETLPPPLVGETVDEPFPPSSDADPTGDPPSGPLEVLRYQPDGEVDIAPFLTVTFNQPMVPLTTLGQLDEADVPVTITPAIEGRWRWIGTRTLRFEVEPGATDRLPAATEYVVEVPAGTSSASGAELAETVSWTFATPPPRVTSFVGESDSLPVEPVFVAVFDQLVDPAAVLATVALEAGGQERPLRIATADEIAADEAAERAMSDALEGRAVALRPEDPLPADTPITIVIGPGTPSLEGPRRSTEPATYRARTFGALRVVRHECGWGRRCEPGMPFVIELSNPLDMDAVDADMVTVEPAIPGLVIDVHSSMIELRGATAGRTTYTVELDAGLKDVFGQTLGEDVALDFPVGSAHPAMRAFDDRQWVTLDPMAESPHTTVLTINHDSVRVEAWAVSPADVAAYRRFWDSMWSDTNPPVPDWQRVLDTVVEIDAEPDRFVETPIDLSSAFDASSQLVVRITPTRSISRNDDIYWDNRPSVAWVQSTTLAVDAVLDGQDMLIWTTDLRTGEPVGRVPVELLGDGRTATTDADGLARVELGDRRVTGLVATSGDATAFLPASWYDGWERQARTNEGRWYVFDDRGVYRPGETARIAGWVRRLDWADDARLELYGDQMTIDYTVTDAQGAELASGSVDTNALGGFNFAVDLSPGANLGQAWVELRAVDLPSGEQATTTHTFQIQEFRRPEFEVETRAVTPAPHYAGEPVTVAVDAGYYAGGPLVDAEVTWLVSSRETNYRPPGWDEYQFGRWQPWWWSGGDRAVVDVADCLDCWPGGEVTYEEFSGRTDASGSHHLEIGLDGEADLPTSVTAEATVVDLNRQGWAARTDLLVHPGRYYVGLRTERHFVEQGTPIVVAAVVTDVDGDAVDGRDVEITAGRLEWAHRDGSWVEELADAETCTITSTGDEPVECEFATDVGGTYRITAVVEDDAGGHNRTEITQWVTGGSARPVRGVDREQVTIVPDRETYAPGDTAELLVQAPFSPAHGVVMVVRGGIVSYSAFEAEDGSAVLEIPIEDAHVPNLSVTVEMVGNAPRTADDGTPLPDAPARPAYATGELALRIPPVTRALAVTATPADAELEPGDATTVTVQVAGPHGTPVEGAEVAVVIVDEAVLALTGYELIDPLDVFYADIPSTLYTELARAGIVLTRADLLGGDLPEGAPAPTAPGAIDDDGAAEEGGGDTAGGAASDRPDTQAGIELRTDFDPLAVFAPDETTGPDGTVTVDVDLPDNLTRYRVMAVAVDGADHFGKAESAITARLPLMARPSAPRFLNFGDRVELPVVVQNQTDEPLVVDVVVQGANLMVEGSGGKRVTVPANDRVEVRFPASTDEAGIARYRVAAVSGSYSDAAEGELPVYTPATAEAFATYGVIDDGAVAQPLLEPTGVFPQFGGLEINTSSTALQALTDAVIYLVDYRYESSDGYASRLMAIAALRDVLDAFDAEGLPSAQELNAQVRRDIEGLGALQNDDGGFPYWQRGRDSIPWPSIQATHALVVADQAGYAVPTAALESALRFLADIEQHIPRDYEQGVRDSLSAYALHVRELAGAGDAGKALDLYRRAGSDLEVDALAWIWPSIADAAARDEIERTIRNRATETAGAATFATEYGEGAWVIAVSDRRTDGIVLDALITETPESDLIPKAVAGLLGGQTRGRWNNAHENAFILLALHRYFETYESVTPDFVARAWLGEDYVAEHEYRGRTVDRASTLVPMEFLLAGGEAGDAGDGVAPVVIQKDGDGRLYYRLGLRYAPIDLALDPRDEGFVVEREYEAIDDPADVHRNPDGSWTIRAGANVRVRLTMVADAQRTHVALVDPLPAGFEALNPSLTVSQTIRPENDAGDGDVRPLVDWWCWCWNWFEHQNLRDDRAEAFAGYLPGGTYEYTYVARATTPGEFVVPPARAEEIYSPEVFGRSAIAVVTIAG